MFPATSRRSIDQDAERREQHESRRESCRPCRPARAHRRDDRSPAAVTAADQRLVRAARAIPAPDAHASTQPSTTAAATSAQVVGGSSCNSSTSPPFQSHNQQRAAQRRKVALRSRCTRSGRANSRASASGTGDLAADQRLDDLAEFCRMRGRDQNPARRCRALGAAGARRLRPRPRYAGTRSGRTARSPCGCARGSASSSTESALATARAARQCPETGTQALHVARVAHVHRGRQRGDAGARLPLAASSR